VIDVGDLVMVAKVCECGFVPRPHIFVVKEIRKPSPAGWKCWNCDAELKDELGANDGKPWLYPLSWLKRIPPVDEIDHEELIKEITEKQRSLV